MGKKKNAKAKLKKQQKKAASKANQQKVQNKKKKPNNNNNNNDGNLPKNSVLDEVNPELSLKEFIRDITLHNFSLSPIGGGNSLIKSCNIKLTHGHIYGLIGHNGAGKTTFLKKLSSGTLREIPKYLRVIHTHQELPPSDMTVIQTILKADTEREKLLTEQKRIQAQIDKLSNINDDNDNNNNEDSKASNNNNNDNIMMDKLINDLNTVHERLKFIEADTAEARVSDVLEGLSFTDRMKNMKTSDLSGGWRMRVALACALFVEPDLLLLDEPTNHLDFPSVIWLSEYLGQCYPEDKTIVVVSHDRRFLNDICTDIIHLDKQRLFFYKGNYEAFIRIRNESRVHQRKQYERQQAMIKHNTEFIARFKANKKWSTQAQSRQKLLNKVERIEKVLSDLEFRFDFPKPPPLKNDKLLYLDEVTFGYFGEDDPSTFLLKNINIRLDFGTKIGILGANGSGKTTLLQLILGNIKPIHGSAVLQNSVEVGYFTQHHVDQLDFNATPLQHLKHVFKDATIQQIYSQLGRFKLGQEYAKRKIGTLSGGQKSRIAFAILTWYSPHLIIMDEPTNHLDMPTIDALTAALCDFPGSVVIVSHDQYFVETICDEYWAVGNRSIKMFDNFERCRKYSQTVKPIDVLPREFSTVQVKSQVFEERKGNDNENNNNDNNNANGVAKKKKKANVVDNSAFGIDPEREIDKGLDKGLTPDQILRHIKGWKPIDGNPVVTNKLGFILFHDYFDENYQETDENEFFSMWKNLLNYCIPTDFIKNQFVLIDISYACYKTANKDKKKKAIGNFAFGTIIKNMFELDIITMDALKEWLDKKRKKYDEQFIKQIDTYIEILNDDDDDDDSDDDSD